MTRYEFHPLADAFPLMEGQDFADLVQSIKDSGQRELIVLFDGKILDGRNRYRACSEVGIEPRTREFTGTDPIKFVIDANIRRRHLTESQRGMAAAAIAQLQRGQQKQQHIENNDQSNAQICASSQDEAAQMLNVGRRTVQHGRTVLNKGTPELTAAVKQGHISISKAAALAKKPKEEQKQAVKEAVGTRGKKKRRPRGSNCPISSEPEPRHELDIRRIEVAWEVACDSAKDEFLRRIGLLNYDWRSHQQRRGTI